MTIPADAFPIGALVCFAHPRQILGPYLSRYVGECGHVTRYLHDGMIEVRFDGALTHTFGLAPDELVMVDAHPITIAYVEPEIPIDWHRKGRPPTQRRSVRLPVYGGRKHEGSACIL